MSDFKQVLSQVLSAILKSSEQDSVEAYQEVADLETVKQAVRHAKEGDPELFHLELIVPFEQVVEGLLLSITSNDDFKFLLMNYDFIESNFKQLISRYEGSSFSADKSRTIMKALAWLFSTGELIDFSYEGEAPYYYPTTIFNTHDEVLTFFNGLKGLYYGHSSNYLRALGRIMLDREVQKIEDRDQPRH